MMYGQFLMIFSAKDPNDTTEEAWRFYTALLWDFSSQDILRLYGGNITA